MYDYTNKQKALKFGLGASQSGEIVAISLEMHIFILAREVITLPLCKSTT